MEPVKIKENIYWVGGVDWDLRNFHGYITHRGSTYNAYLIIDEKTTLVDTVKHYLFEEMIERISKIIDPCKIDYIISNHVEMDHSGSLPLLMNLVKDAVIYCSPQGEKGLKEHYKKDWNFKSVKTGDEINLGKRTIQFLQTQMVHWPDNMVSYCKEEKLLFSNDSFGQHIASSQRFDDEYPYDIFIEEAKKYYANIVLPYGMQVQKELEAAKKLDIEIICPSHGLILRKYIPQLVENYEKWSFNKTEETAIIVYDTMWKSSQKMAYAIAGAFEKKGIPYSLRNLQVTHISDIMTELITSKYVCIGSPTLNKNILPTVSGFITYLKGLAPKNRIGLAFGSYGWGGESIKDIEAFLSNNSFQSLCDPIKVKYVPDNETLCAITEQVYAAL